MLISAHWPLPNALASEECIHEISDDPCACIACVRGFVLEQYGKLSAGQSAGSFRTAGSKTRRWSTRRNGDSGRQSDDAGQSGAWEKTVLRHAIVKDGQHVL